MRKIFYLTLILQLICTRLYSKEINQINIDTLNNKQINKYIEQIPKEILSVELQMLFNSTIAINYEKQIYTTNDLFTLNYEIGLGVTQWYGNLDAITQQFHLRAMLGKRHCLELGTGVYLNYFVKDRISHNPNLTSDFVKLRADLSYRFHTTYIDQNGKKDTDLFKITLGVYYMFNKTPKDIYLENGLIKLSPSDFPNSNLLFINLGLSFNLWTL